MEQQGKIQLKVNFFHGLEGELFKSKQPYLEKQFVSCKTPQMKVSRWNVLSENSFPRCLFRNMFKASKAGSECLKNCLKIQVDAISLDKPDIVFGESWGGGIGLLLLAYGHWDGPIVLIAPALIRFLRIAGELDIKVDEILRMINDRHLGPNILLIHGEKDKTIPYQNSLDIMKIVQGIEFWSLKDGDHELKYLIKDNQLATILVNHYEKVKKQQIKQNINVNLNE